MEMFPGRRGADRNQGGCRWGLPGLVLVLISLGWGAPAGARFFYQHPFPDVDWLVYETAHFRIFYYPQEEWTARKIAKYAEIAYHKVTGQFDYPLQEKINVVVRDQEDYSNGWAAYNFDQITMWATPLYYILRGRQDWIPDAFTHEFTHIVSLKANSWKSEGAVVVVGQGLVEDGVHNIDFGAAVVIGWNTPWFWAEGIAEYGTHLAGFNWWTTSRDMHQRMSMLEDNYLDYEQMFNRGMAGTSFDGERGYQQGYTMGLFVMEKYGKEKWAQLALNSGEQGHLSWDKNFEDVLGVDGPTLYRQWLQWMKDRYRRQAEPIRRQEHLGFSLKPLARGGWPEVLEKNPDGRWKVRLWPQRCIPREYRQRDNLEALAIALFDDPEQTDRLAALDPFALQRLIEEKLHDAGIRKRYLERFKELRRRYGLKSSRVVFWNKKQRKSAMESQGQWHMYPRFSPDGKWLAYSKRRQLVLEPVPEEEQPQFTGYCIDKERREEIADDTKVIRGASSFLGYEFSPDGKKVLFSSISCPNTSLPCVSLDGYYRMDLYEYDIASEQVTRLSRRLRAYLPSYSPDGKTIAFVHVEDGQNHLGVMPAAAREVRPDGTCLLQGRRMKDCVKWLIRRHDGTLLGQPSFSPDGRQIVIDLYHDNQQDVWMLDSDGGNLHPLTWDRAEDRDARFTPDGRAVVYSSDRTGVFNIYRLDLASGRVVQLTNVLGGAFNPFITSSGDLLYSYFTSYGLRLYALRRADFFNRPATVDYQVTAEQVKRSLERQEALPEIAEDSDSYNPFSPRNWAPPIGVPMFIYERRGIEIGGQVLLVDALDKHMLAATMLLGQQSVYSLTYVNNFWYPSFYVGWTRLNLAYEFAQGFTSSALAPSRSDPHFPPPVNYKNRQVADFGWVGFDYRLAPQLGFNGRYVYRHLSSKRSSGTKEQAFLTNNTYTLGVEYQDLARRGPEADVNPRGGRRVALDYGFVRTGLPTKDWADVEWLGRSNPPGDHSDDYRYHELQLGYTEYLPIFWWNKEGRHTLELHLRAGWINRNVHRWDEFFAGSLHPLRYVPTFSTTQEFAGYEDFSLRGETMLILGLSYRFPLARHIDRRFGPLHFVSLWAEISGTMGNLWGYTADYARDRFGNIMRNPESYWDPAVIPGSIRRERPFFDISSKNGNYMLYDLSVTLKLKAYLFGVQPWNSFIRIAYGFNDIIGQYEVNDDYAFVDAYPNNALYAEVEPKSIRISIGIGSNFD